jgi:predicted RecB family endonuclease
VAQYIYILYSREIVSRRDGIDINAEESGEKYTVVGRAGRA